MLSFSILVGLYFSVVLVVVLLLVLGVQKGSFSLLWCYLSFKMPKVRRSSSLSLDRSRAFPYPCTSENAEQYKVNSPLESTENAKEWEDTRCPICMEHPHNAVLIKCSSHEKGCRPYMCNTSYRHSNCLDQFCKSSVPESTTMMLQELPLTHTASNSSSEEESLPGQTSPCGSPLQLHPACPLCRGKIYGYIVVEAARHFMNCKVRCCSTETCDFSGTYSELRKHARSEHPYVRPSEVDPNRHDDWRRFERQWDLQDVLSIVQVGSGDDIVQDLSNGSGLMSLVSVFRYVELFLSTLVESSSDMEQTHGRRSRTSVQQDSDTIPATGRYYTSPRRLLWRESNNNAETRRTPRRSHNSLSGEAGNASRRSTNSSWGNSLSEEVTNRALRRVSNTGSETTTRVHRRENNSVLGESNRVMWGNNSVLEESNHHVRRRGNNSVSEESRWGNNSLLDESNHVRRRGNNSVSEESRWGNNSVSEEVEHAPRRGNTSVPESTRSPGGLRWRRNQRFPTSHYRR